MVGDFQKRLDISPLHADCDVDDAACRLELLPNEVEALIESSQRSYSTTLYDWAQERSNDILK